MFAIPDMGYLKYVKDLKERQEKALDDEARLSLSPEAYFLWKTEERRHKERCQAMITAGRKSRPFA